MGTKRPYRKSVEYHFEVEGEGIAITEVGKNFMCVEETRKNGHEDTHMSGVLCETTDGKWLWEDEKYNPFRKYGSDELADGIIAYVNEHGRPGTKKVTA